MDSRKIRLSLLTGVMTICLVAVTQCQRSRDVRPAGPETASPWTLTLAAPIDHLDAPAREPMIVEHPDGTLFVSGYGSGVPALWKSGDSGATWSRVKVGTIADGAAGNSDVDLAVGPNGEIAVRVIPQSAAGPKYDEGVDLIAVSTDGGMTWTKHAAPGYREWNPDWFRVPRWVEPLAWDAAGGLYSLWTNLKGIWLARSLDQGATWKTWRLRECPEVAYFPYLVARGRGELAATWFSSWTGTWQAHVARIDVGEGETPPRFVESAPFKPASLKGNQRWPEDPQTPDTAGECLAVSFLRNGGLVVVSPIQNRREKRFGFSVWKLEERRGEGQLKR